MHQVTRLVPSSSTSTLQFGVSSNNGWDAALIVRNLFDEDAAGYMSGSDYGEFFGDPRRVPLPRHAAAAEDRQPVVHQAMVTRAGMG